MFRFKTTSSLFQCFVLLLLFCSFQIVIFEYWIPSSSNQNECSCQCITLKQHNIVIEYLMDKNKRLSAQIKDLIFNIKQSELMKLDRANRIKYKPQPRPYKTMNDVQSLLPVPLIDVDSHQKFEQHQMCHFLPSNHHKKDIYDRIDLNTINKMNEYIQKHPNIPNNIQNIESLIEIPSLTISTYNIWNTNAFMNERMIQIAEILKTFHLDVVGFQEVRWIENGKRLQHELILNVLNDSWNWVRGKMELESGEAEYLVIASKFEIESSKVYKFRGSNGRILMFASIKYDETTYIDLFHTHFGLNAASHCTNIRQIIPILNEHKSKKQDRLQIILGDFNTYLDFEYPLDLLLIDDQNKENDLLKHLLRSKCNDLEFQNEFGPFVDVWKEKYGDSVDVMRTFTNFEDHRIEDFTMTDHILYRNGNNNRNWQVCDFWIAGDQSIEIDGQQIYPSDHRTVIAKLYAT